MSRKWERFVLAAVEELTLYCQSATQLPPNSSLPIIETANGKKKKKKINKNF